MFGENMRSFQTIFLLLLSQLAYSARLPIDLEHLPENNSDKQTDNAIPDDVKDSSETDDVSEESSPIESRYEVPDSESEEDAAYDVIFGEVLRDILETLQSHPEFFKGLTNKEVEQTTQAEGGREVIDENYPRSDISEESREFDQFLTKIQEGGQEDPMFDYERQHLTEHESWTRPSQPLPGIPVGSINLDSDLKDDNLQQFQKTSDNHDRESEDTTLSSDGYDINLDLPYKYKTESQQGIKEESKKEESEKLEDFASPKYRVQSRDDSPTYDKDENELGLLKTGNNAKMK